MNLWPTHLANISESDLSESQGYCHGHNLGEGLLKAIFEAVPDAILVIDHQGHYVDVNPAACTLLGVTQADLVGRSLMDSTLSGLDFASTWTDGLAQERGELQLCRSDSSVRIVEYQVTANIAPDRHVVFLRDVTLQKQAEVEAQRLHKAAAQREGEGTETCQRSNHWLARLAVNVPGVIFQYHQNSSDVHGAFTYISPGVTDLFELNPDEVCQNSDLMWSRVHPDDLAAFIESVEVAARKRQNWEIETRIVLPDNHCKWIYGRSCPDFQSDGSIVWDGFLLDITERKWSEIDRKELEKTLHRHEQRLNSILETVEDVIWSGNIENFETTYVNPAVEKIYGYAPADFVNNPRLWLDCIHPEDRESARLAYENLRCSHYCAVQYRITRSDGTVRWLYDRAHAVCDEAGYPIRIDGIATDITQRKRIEADFQKNSEMLQKLSEQVPGMIYQYRLYPDGRSCFPYASDAIRQIYEVSPEQVQENADSVFLVLHPDDAPQVRTSIQQSYQTLQLWHDEYRVILPQRGIRWLEGHAMPERLEDGSVLWHGYIWDITERKQLYLALQAVLDDASRTRAKLNDVLNSATAAIVSARVLLDRTVEYEYWSAGCSALFGFTAEALMADRQLWWSRVLPADIEKHVNPSFDLIFAGQPFQFEYQFQHADGGWRWIAVSATSRWDMTAHCWVVTKVHTDISERKAAEQILQLQAERERILSDITQHIRQSLNVGDILNTAVTEINQLLQADRVIVYRFNPNWSGDIIVESVVDPWATVVDTTLRDPCFTGLLIEQYRQGRISLIENIQAADVPPCYRQLLDIFQIQANLVVPINCDGTLWGLLCVHQCRSARKWQSWEIELLQQLSARIAIALQQGQLYQEAQELNASLEKKVAIRTKELRQSLDFEALLKRITDKVRDSLEEAQILQTVVDELAIGLNVECCDTGIYNEEHTTSTIAYECVRNQDSTKGKVILIAEAPHPEIYPSLFQGLICLFCDVSPFSLRAQQRIYSVLACPILDDQGVLGDLWLFKPCDQTFSQLEIRLVQQVANQCAIALRQSRLYQTAQMQVVELERLNQLKDDFLSTVSHELRSPMSNIKMATQMLEITLKRLGVFEVDNHVVRYFQILQDEGRREISLINDLLDLARLDADVEPLFLTTIGLQDWIPHIVEPFINRCSNQQQTLRTNIPDDLPAITTDLTYLERILTELLHNACKYTPAGEQIQISAGLETSSQLPCYAITVTNTGMEISPIECERMFEKFYRIPNQDPWRHGGTGLGLSLARKLMEKLGGTIMARSGNGQVSLILQLPDHAGQTPES